MTDIIVQPHYAPSQPTFTQRGSLLRMGEASQLFRISHATIRKWDSEGKLRCVRTPGGTRLVDRQSLLECLGLEERQEGICQTIIAYCRTSTARQADDLQRQIEKVKAFTLEKFGVEPVIFSETGSGLSDSRQKYLKLIEMVVENKVGVIVCFSKDRLSRYGNNVFQHLCELKDVRLVFMDNEDGEKSYEQELAEDLMAIVHVYSCRHYSRRAMETLRRKVEEDAKQRLMDLHREGYSMTEITEILIEEGFVCKKDGKPYTTYLIRKAIYEGDKEEKIRQAADSSIAPKERDIVDQFLAECCTLEKDSKVYSQPLYEAFTAYALKAGKKVITRATFGHRLTAKGFRRGKSSGGYISWYGLFLTNNTGASHYNAKTKRFRKEGDS